MAWFEQLIYSRPSAISGSVATLTADSLIIFLFFKAKALERNIIRDIFLKVVTL